MAQGYLLPLMNALQSFTNQGVVLAGGKIKTYLAGTTTPVATYTDSTLVVSNGVSVTLDSAGRPPNGLWVPAGQLTKFVVTTSANVQVGPTLDYVPGINDQSALGSISTIGTIANLRAATAPTGSPATITVQGYYTPGDGGGGQFFWDSTSALADNNGTVINPTGHVGNGRWIRIIPQPDLTDVRWFGAKGDGATNDTAAWNAAMAAAPYGSTVYGTGDFKIDPLTYPGPITIKVNGTWRPTTTFIIPANVNFEGDGGQTSEQFGIGDSGCCIVVPVAGNIPTLEVQGSQGHYLKNIVMQNPVGPGIHLNTCVLVTLENVNIRCDATATAYPLKVSNSFWVYIKGGSYITVAGGSGYSIWLNSEVAPGAYTGLVYIEGGTVLSGNGILLRSRGANLDAPFFFRDIVYENCLTDFLTIDIQGAGVVGDIYMRHCELTDQIVSPLYKIKTIGTAGPQGIILEDDNLNELVLNPASTVACGFMRKGLRRFPYSTPLPVAPTPAWSAQAVSLEFQGLTDTRLLSNSWLGGPALAYGAPLPFSQDPTTWTPNTSTLTTGITAPDGSATAATVSGAAGNIEIGTGAETTTAAVGDWFIAGIWTQTAYPSGAGPCNPTISIQDVPGFVFNGSASAFLAFSNDAGFDDSAWHCNITAAKITTSAGGTPLMRFRLTQTNASAVTKVWMPFVIRIPAGTRSDFEVTTIARSMRSIPKGAVAGDVALLDHQKLKIGGGIRFYSGAAAPAAGAWLIGDVVFNTAPAIGAPAAWSCTASGTPGTWRAWANL